MSIDKSFIDKIESMAKPETLEVAARPYSTKPIHAVLEPTAVPLDTHTLLGIVDYLATGDFCGQVIIHVENYDRVLLKSAITGSFRQREVLVLAEAYELEHGFGRPRAVEDFIVFLQSMFAQDETTAKIMQIVGNLSQGTEASFADDGMTQRVTAKAGVARVEVVDLPNPVTLRPFRTFADIEQPASKFVLRIKADKDHGPTCALFEADGGAWKNTAIATIKAWLAANAPGGIKIIA